MSETAHTPGPWQVKNDYDGRTEVIANVDGEAFADGTQSHSFDFICNTAWDWYGDDKDAATAAANARLISAAPDMLEALKAYREADAADDAMRETHERATAEDWVNDPTGSLHVWASVKRYNDAVRRANELRDAAISKATGEPVEMREAS